MDEIGSIALLAKILPITRESWAGRARCIGTDPAAWYPEQGDSAEFAKRICRSCEVRVQCGNWADTHEEWGIWSGKFRTKVDRRNARLLEPAA